jgi:glycosyltransferase involved in cell wall biosynthesis/SAM-dependent methyltransferase
MLLTIGMMVKNEEKHLTECLSSLDKIRDELDSELVIVDTGSDDNTVEIAKKYTDKVYFHEWNDNFSEMRNTVISYAKGDWYFSLDGDEILNNPETIINFFKSGKHKKYNAGLVTQKNYTNLEENRFSKILVPRLFKNDKDFCFKGAVHNQPQYKKPVYGLDTILDHYGYVSSDAALIERKFQRTSNILKQELEKDPTNVYYWFQLSKSYNMHKDQEDALDAIEEAYKVARENDLDLSIRMYVLIQLAKMYLINNQYRMSEQIAENSLKIKDGYVDLYYYLARAQLLQGKKEDSLNNFKKYIKLIDNYDQTNSKIDTSVDDETMGNYNIAYRFIIALAADLEIETDYAIEAAFKIDVNSQLEHAIHPFISICLNNKNYQELKNFNFEQLDTNNLKNKFINILEKLKSNSTIEEKKKVNALFIDLEGNREYSLLNKIRNNIYNNNFEIKIEELETINYNIYPDFYGDIIYYLFKLNSDAPYKILTSIREENLNRFIKYLNKKYDDLFEQIESFINLEIDGIATARVNKSLSRYLLAFDNEIEENNKQIIDNYLDSGLKYIESLYAKTIIDKELIYELKSEEEAFLLYMYKAFEVKEDNLKSYIQYLRKAIDIYPLMKKVVETLMLEVKKEQDKIAEELEKKKSDFKERIEALINQGEIEESKKLIEKYEQSFELDADIYSMKSVILINKALLEEAKELLVNGLKIYPNSFDLNFNLAFIYENKKKYKKAYEIYTKIIDRTPNENILNNLEQKVNNLKSKIKVPEKIIKKNESENEEKKIAYKPEEINNEIVNLFKQKRHQNILNEIQKLNKKREYKKILDICNYWFKKVNNHTAAIHYYAGVAFNGLGFYKKAIEHHKEALKNDKALADIKNRNSKYQGKYNESKTNCLGCNSDDFTIVNVNNQSRVKDNKELINPLRIWVKCNNCGLIYTNPIPDKDSLNKYYSLLADEDDINVENRFEFLVRMSNKRLEKIERYHSRSTLLDIGTGSGFFVGAAIDRGWEANGLELAEGNCQYAKENFNIDLINKDFYDFSPEQKYDVVTLFEVIEHLRDPVQAINKARKLLKEDGIFVLATPIRDSLYGKKAKEKNIFWTTVEHLIYFDKNVMIDYLNDNGFELLESNLSDEGMGRMEFYCQKIK